MVVVCCVCGKTHGSQFTSGSRFGHNHPNSPSGASEAAARCREESRKSSSCLRNNTRSLSSCCKKKIVYYFCLGCCKSVFYFVCLFFCTQTPGGRYYGTLFFTTQSPPVVYKNPHLDRPWGATPPTPRPWPPSGVKGRRRPVRRTWPWPHPPGKPPPRGGVARYSGPLRRQPGGRGHAPVAWRC